MNIMKKVRIYRKHILLISIFIVTLFLTGSFVYGQYTGNLPPLATPMENNYSHDQTTLGYYMLMNYNGHTDGDKAIYSFLFAGNNEVVRICQNGTLALMGSRVGGGKYPTFNLYTPEGSYLSSIDCKDDNLNLKTIGSLNMFTNTSHPIAAFKTNWISLYETMTVEKNNIVVRCGLDSSNESGWIGTTSQTGCFLGAGSHSNMYMDTNYGVYIGGVSVAEVNGYKTELKNKYKLFVKYGVLSEDFGIAPKSTWSDFVFNDNYNLPDISEVESFINENNHLPDVPSAKQVAEEGYSQHDMNKVLLQKIEELTLYIIQQQKEIDALKTQLQESKK